MGHRVDRDRLCHQVGHRGAVTVAAPPDGLSGDVVELRRLLEEIDDDAS